jgi:hypothetical protein
LEEPTAKKEKKNYGIATNLALKQKTSKKRKIVISLMSLKVAGK